MNYNFLPKDPGVYMIYNYQNKRRYIGYTNNLYRRIVCEHLKNLNHNWHTNKLLQHDWNTDCSSFVFTIVEKTNDKSREVYWTNYYESNKTGYNIYVGSVKDESTRTKISIANTGRTSSNKGKKMSEEQKIKLSLANKGKPHGTAWNKGLTTSDIVRQKQRESALRRHQIERGDFNESTS